MDMYICRQTKDTFVNNPNSIFSKYLKPEPICISSKGKIKEGYVNLLKKCTFERLLVIESVILMDRIRGLFEIFGQKISVQTLDFEIFGRETHLEDYFPAIFNYVTPRKIDIPLDCPEFYRVSTDISLLNLLTPANEIFLYLPVHAPANTSPWMYTIAFKKLVEESVKIQNVERFTIIQGEWKWNFYASMRQILKAFKEARDPSKMFQKYAFTMVEEMYFYDILKSRNFSFRVEDEVEICEHTRADQWSIKIMFSELKPEDADPHNLKVLIYKK
uniref:Uncharacterized protein n=1 Tax=Acrobeloides nanus TaxID=290746 RepID=A0A914D7Y2_9BILA